jgi:menaquinone-dependent protoporphyrinogen IX oxidase
MGGPNRTEPDLDRRGRILLIYAATQDHTRVIAEAVASRLRSHGYTVEVGDVSTGRMPPPEDYDAVVLGFDLGSKTGSSVRYVDDNRAGLAQVPTALFTVSTSGTERDVDPGGCIERFLRSARWQPDIAAAFAGGKPFPREGMLVRFGKRLGYLPPEGSLGAISTHWTDVERFGDAVAMGLAGVAVTEERTEPHVPYH